jgi:hypothetical protein
MAPKKISTIVLKKELKKQVPEPVITKEATPVVPEPKKVAKKTATKTTTEPKVSVPIVEAPKQSQTKSIPRIEKSEYEEPNTHSFLHVEKKILKMEIKLPKIPMKLIECDMQNDRYVIDTTKYTKKLYASKPYYGGVSIEPTKVTAEFDGTTLKLTAPVTNIPKETLEKEASVVSQRRKGREIKFEAPIAKRVIAEEKKLLKKQEKTKRRRENLEFPNKKKK